MSQTLYGVKNAYIPYDYIGIKHKNDYFMYIYSVVNLWKP